MSGMMQAPMPQMAPQGAGAPPQLPSQVLQMLMQRQQQGEGGPPMGGATGPMPAQPQQPPQGGPNPFAGAQPGQAPQPGQQPMTPAQMAAKGRFGDQIVAHVTPGEISIPPQVQTPQLIHAIQQAFARFGVSLPQFTAGSPENSRNPATGAPELSLWSAILPVVGGIAGSVVPGIGTAAGAALGGAAGGLAGGLIDHAPATTIALQAAGGAAGGYLGAGGLGGAAGGAGSTPSAEALLNAPAGGASGGGMISGGVGGGWSSAPTAGAGAFGLGQAPAGGAAGLGSLYQIAKPGLAAGLGSGLAGALGPQSQASNIPAGFNTPLGAINKNFGSLLGSNQSSAPSFTNYNPYTSVAGPNPGYSFFPTQA